MNRRTLLKQAGAAASAVFASSSLFSRFAPRAAAQAPAQPPIPLATTLASSGTFVLPPLPYSYDALEPFIDVDTMHLHHDKHHAAYVDKLNAAVAGEPSLSNRSLHSLLTDLASVPEPLRVTIRNQAGGHANHSFWWPTLGKSGSRVPQGVLAADINTKFGSFPEFQNQLTKAATSVFGSGWAWLNLDAAGLRIDTTPNQDSPLSTGKTPVLGIDVWEHAYYLKYQNRRADYLKSFFSVVNWDYVSAEYARSKAVKA